MRRMGWSVGIRERNKNVLPEKSNRWVFTKRVGQGVVGKARGGEGREQGIGSWEYANSQDARDGTVGRLREQY